MNPEDEIETPEEERDKPEAERDRGGEGVEISACFAGGKVAPCCTCFRICGNCCCSKFATREAKAF